jgi:very-short-patch-repair endonuclease
MKPVDNRVPCPLSRERERAGVRVPAIDRARALRRNQTDAEALLWSRLRGRQLQGFKFRRQHSEPAAQAHDARRTTFIEQQGLRVIRFWNHEVLTETVAVLEKILQTLRALTPTLSRSRERG